MEIEFTRLNTTILFAILFILIGLIAPIAYINIAPNSQFVEVHDFDASDTYTGADSHEVCFNRTVFRPSHADITIELVLVDEKGKVVEADSFEVDAYYQEGREKVVVSRELRHESMEPGEYYYLHSVDLKYYNGLATKSLVFTSDEFKVYESKTQVPDNASC